MQVRRLALVKQREAKATQPAVPTVEVRTAGPSPCRQRPASASSRLTDHWLTEPPAAMLEAVEPYLQFAASTRPQSAQRGAARSAVAQRPSSAAARSQQHSGADAASCARPSSAQPQQPPPHRQPPQQPPSQQQPHTQQAFGSALRRPGSAQQLRRPTSANLGSRSAAVAVAPSTAPGRRPRPASASAAGGLARSHTTVALLQRPLSASRVSATEGTRTMAAAASAAAAGTRATAAAAVAAANAAAASAPHHAAYRPARVASAVPDELRVTTWLPIYTGHDLPAADRDSGFAWRHGGMAQPAEVEFLPHTAEVFITADGAEDEGDEGDEAAEQETGAADGGDGDEYDGGADDGPAPAPAATAPQQPMQPPPSMATTKKGPPPAAMLPSEGWGRQEFPSHSGKPSRNHAELLLAMMKAVEEQETAQQQKERGGSGAGGAGGAGGGGAGGGGGDGSMVAEAAALEAAAVRLEKARKLYGGVATELCRQLRSESKQRAQVYEHGQSGRLGGAMAGHHGLIRLHLKDCGCPRHS